MSSREPFPAGMSPGFLAGVVGRARAFAPHPDAYGHGIATNEGVDPSSAPQSSPAIPPQTGSSSHLVVGAPYFFPALPRADPKDMMNP